MDDARQRALDAVVAIASEQQLTIDEIAGAIGDAGGGPGSVVEPAPGPAAGRRRELVVRVLGFLGGTFVFAGIGVFVALQWDDMTSAARVVVTLGSGVSAFVLAILAGGNPRFEKASTPFFLIAASLEPVGMVVAFDEYGSGGDWHLASLVTFGAMTLQFAAAFASIRRSALLFMLIVFGTTCVWTLFDLLDVDQTLVAIVLGGSLLLAAVGAERGGHGDITPVWYFIGAVAFLGGVFDAVEATPVEISFLAMAAGFVYLGAALRSRTLLLVSTIAILAYTGYFTGQHFADSIGWPISLIGFGLFIIGLSAVVYRIDRDYVRRTR